MRKELRTRQYGWWFVMIAAGFVLLALNGCLIGSPARTILVQCATAGIFLLLGVYTLRTRKP